MRASVLASLAVLLASGPASADENGRRRPGKKPPPASGPNVLDPGPSLVFRFDFGISAPSVLEGLSVRGLVPDLHFRLRVTEDLWVEADWGFAVSTLSANNVSETTTRVGNPGLALHYARTGERLRLRAGLGATAPVASVNDEDLDLLALQLFSLGLANGMYGQWDSWRWLPQSTSVTFPLGIDYGLTRRLLVGVDLEPAVLISTSGEDTEAVVQTAIELRYRAAQWTLGLRTQAVFFPTFEVPDKAQVSLLPFVDYDIGSTTLGMRLLMNLDGPNGFAFSQGGIWGLWFGLGFSS